MQHKLSGRVLILQIYLKDNDNAGILIIEAILDVCQVHGLFNK